MFDLLIVGAGCAGCSAAITARQRNLSVLMVYSGDGGLEKAARVDNYPGMPRVGGMDMINAFRRQAVEMGAELKKALVTKVLPMEKSFSVLAGNDIYEAKTILLALGIARVNPLPGEEELLGQGVSYCATCDGMFYRNMDIIVVGAGGDSVEEANYLAEIGRVRYFSEKAHSLQELSKGIEVIAEKPRAISQQGRKLMLETDKGSHEADGIFVLRPAVAMTQLLPEAKVEKNALIVDKELMTSVPGVFAAGDIIGAPLQAAKAVGEGNVVALSAALYLRRRAADNA